MLEVAERGAQKSILEGRDIRELGRARARRNSA